LENWCDKTPHFGLSLKDCSSIACHSERMAKISAFPSVPVRRNRQTKRWARKHKAHFGFDRLFVFGVVGTFWLVWTATEPTIVPATQMISANAGTDRHSAQFGLCHSGGGMNCVVDGDTIWFDGRKIRIADIDTPETHPARCAEEERLGNAATIELQRLLNNGPFSLTSIDRDTDTYGRSLRIITRNGNSIGGTLVGAGLARWYGSGRQPWC
jgi:micrococcal nuclease